MIFLMRLVGLCSILLIFFLVSCSSINSFFFESRKRAEVFSYYKLYQKDDYLDQLASLGTTYLNSSSIVSVSISKQHQKYLLGLYEKIIRDNELLFKKDIRPKFHVLKDDKPFYFSLPGAQFFMSTGLIKKYFLHEDLLLSMLVAEIVRVHHLAYKKSIMVPVGYLSTERMLSLVKLELAEKSEINKWSYYAMRRSGHDAAAYLNWLQLQNKNTLDFLFQMGGDLRRISKEEHLLKKFMVLENLAEHDMRIHQRNSSKEFYKFVADINNK